MEDFIAMTTSDSIEGYRVVEYKDIVFIDKWVGTGMGTQLKSNLNIFASLTGSEFTAITEKVGSLVESAKRQLQSKAEALGANALIRVDIESSVADITAVRVVMNGTAVRVEKINTGNTAAGSKQVNILHTNCDLPFKAKNLQVYSDAIALQIMRRGEDGLRAIKADIVLHNLFGETETIEDAVFMNFRPTGAAYLYESDADSQAYTSKGITGADVIIKAYVSSEGIITTDMTAAEISQDADNGFLQQYSKATLMKEFQELPNAKTMYDFACSLEPKLDPEVIQYLQDRATFERYYGADRKHTMTHLEALLDKLY